MTERGDLGAAGPSPVPASPSATTVNLADGGVTAVPDPAAPPLGKIGRYTLISELGRGGMGVVYRVFDEGLRRPAALKAILDPARAGPDQITRFRREAQAVGALKHPNVVSVYESGEHEGKPYFVMELVEGQSLETLLTRERLAPQRVARILRDVAMGLAHAHEKNVIHRDVKPANIIVDPRDVPHLMDFGLARNEAVTAQLTNTGDVLGTPVYMAPEQARGAPGEQGPHTDVYSLGAVLYRALVGRVPFEAPNVQALLDRILNADPVPPRRLEPGLDADLETITLRCLEKEPGRRYKGALDIARELDRYLAGEPIEARPPGRAARLLRKARRNKLATGLILLAAASVLAGAGGVVGVQARARAERTKRLEEAREAAARAHEDFAREAAAVVVSGTDTARRHDRLMALGLTELERQEQRAALGDPEASAAVFEATLGLASVASRAGQWSVAAALCEQAASLDVDAGRAKAAREAVETARLLVLKEHEARVAGILRDAASGELAKRPSGVADAKYVLIGLHEPQTIALVGSALDGVTKKLPKLGPSETLLLGIACEVLGRIGEPAGIEALGRYLEKETDEIRAVEAGVALCRIGGADAERRILSAVQRFGWDGEFWRQVRPFLGLTGVPIDDRVLRTASDYGVRAELRKAKGDPRGAIADLTSALALEPRAHRLWSNRGNIRTELGELDGAIADYTRAIELAPNDAAAWGNRGCAKKGKGDLDGAIADLTSAIALAPNKSHHWCNRGNARRDKGDATGAIADYTKALELGPRDAWTWNNRGAEKEALGDAKGALADFTRAVEVDPRCAQAWSNRGKVKVEHGDLDGGIADCSAAIDLEPRDAHAYFYRGSARGAKGDVSGALLDLDRSIELDATNPRAWSNRATAKDAKKDWDAAIADYTRALELAPDMPEALYGRARGYIMKRRFMRAKKELQRLVEVAPESPWATSARDMLKGIAEIERERDQE